MKEKKVVVFAGYSCNNRCSFCVNFDKRHIADKTTRQIVEEMAAAKRGGTGTLELIGGEMSIRSDFVPLIRTAKKLGFKEIVTATNGRRYAYMDFAKAAVEAGITGIIFSIHGHNARLHDSLTNVQGSFEQLLRGVENLRRMGFRGIFGNTTVLKQNFSFLPEIGGLYLELGIMNVEFIFVDPTYGGAHRHFDRFVPRISEAAPWMRKCLDIGRSAGTRDWTVRYVPLCHFQGYEDQISEIRERRIFHTEHWAPDFWNEDVSASRALVARERTERCNGCLAYADCEGIWKEYIRRYGDGELMPCKGQTRLMKKELNVFLTDRCNQKCLFCSYERRTPPVCSPRQIRESILSQKDTLSIEGGEPVLSKDLLRWVSLARDNGTRDIILCTNGTGLQNRKFVQNLLDAGITLFNVNFPAHIEKLFDVLTRTRGLFKQRVEAIKNILDVAGRNRVRLTFVINKLNYSTMPQYARFVKAAFPGLFYIELNLVKVLGHVKSRRFLVPTLTEIEIPFRSAAEFCEGNEIKFIVDGIPLCFLEGFESTAIDVYKLIRGDRTYLEEKAKRRACRYCSLAAICTGPRIDYVGIHGSKELRSSRKDPGPIIKVIKTQMALGERSG